MNHEPFDAQAAVYAVGALDGTERGEFEAHLRRCDRCQATVRESLEALAAVAAELPPAPPPPEVRERLLRRVEVAAERRRLNRVWLRWSVAVLAAMLVGGLLVGGWVAARYEARLTRAARELSELREQLRRAEGGPGDRAAAEQALLELLGDPATEVFVLRGRDPQALGRVVWNERAGGLLVAAGLAPPPAGGTYALWTIRGGVARPAGLLRVDPQGRAVTRLEPSWGPVDAFAVTLEPAGEVPAPTGPTILSSG